MKLVRSKYKLITAILVVLVLSYGGWRLLFAKNQPASNYQTATVEKGIIVSSVSASGQITGSSGIDVVTQVNGLVKNVFVKNGDSVRAGQTIAQITPDQSSAQKQASAWSSYLSAKNSLASAQANLYTLQNQEFVANQKFMNGAVARNLPTDDPTYIEESASWLAAEAQYKNQQGVIAQNRAALNSAWLTYQQTSPNITAPISGTIRHLTITPGSQLASSTTTLSNQTLAVIVTNKNAQISVDLSEIDAPKVKLGQPATLTLDSQPGKTFTGKVTNVNTNGTVSSGVTSYPTTISFDTAADNIYPNMSVSANIITQVKDNVLTIPSSAIQTVNGQTYARVLQNKQVNQVPVVTGISSDSQTEIVSGLSEGDTIVIGTAAANTNGSSSSPFSGQFRIGGGGGGAVFRGGGR